jgi:hypothetical protein
MYAFTSGDFLLNTIIEVNHQSIINSPVPQQPQLVAGSYKVLSGEASNHDEKMDVDQLV